MSMTAQRDFLLLVISAAAAAAGAIATPAAAQTVAAAAGPVGSPTQGTASIPDFSGVWNHPSLPWFEPLLTGPRPVMNLSRRNGVSNYDQLVGDYKNPILQPWAARVVKTYGDMSLAGITYPNPSNQCWPEPPPFMFKHNNVEMFQYPDRITMVYSGDMRQVRMNQSHPAEVTPSWFGDSVGHYEGDTLVIDTVGIRTDRPYAMIDLFGTPYTKSLHLVERYRLITAEEAKVGLAQDNKENQHFGDISHSPGGKYLQLHLTVEDAGVFTTPWTVTITYGRDPDGWHETVCAENRHEYYYKQDSDVPTANNPDF
jgi:hypothetical protein